MEMLEEVKKLWDKYKLSEDVRKHCMKVAEVALKIANSIESDVGIDKNAVLIGALLHDIGRAVTNDPFLHFIKSAEILRKEGFDDKIVKIAERHF
ncbi:MAG: TIGR00295 family protein, partial [Deltaproteobacteria bacterium]